MVKKTDSLRAESLRADSLRAESLHAEFVERFGDICSDLYGIENVHAAVVNFSLPDGEFLLGLTGFLDLSTSELWLWKPMLHLVCDIRKLVIKLEERRTGKKIVPRKNIHSQEARDIILRYILRYLKIQ